MLFEVSQTICAHSCLRGPCLHGEANYSDGVVNHRVDVESHLACLPGGESLPSDCRTTRLVGEMFSVQIVLVSVAKRDHNGKYWSHLVPMLPKCPTTKSPVF